MNLNLISLYNHHFLFIICKSRSLITRVALARSNSIARIIRDHHRFSRTIASILPRLLCLLCSPFSPAPRRSSSVNLPLCLRLLSHIWLSGIQIFVLLPIYTASFASCTIFLRHELGDLELARGQVVVVKEKNVILR